MIRLFFIFFVCCLLLCITGYVCEVKLFSSHGGGGKSTTQRARMKEMKYCFL
ncbi:hypothetical protein Lalb_Chr18g0054411 [Lupinus albus]|uniref:Uncharacterized protein n=1 Tax=Lupinus albus TaxID=3870 RepID=A0A6A4NLJ1_LUPAL|nr:hypothetical protein Lalb_Chr18g0054411 [Lupinus albus]